MWIGVRVIRSGNVVDTSTATCTFTCEDQCFFWMYIKLCLVHTSYVNTGSSFVEISISWESS